MKKEKKKEVKKEKKQFSVKQVFHIKGQEIEAYSTEEAIKKVK